jgi:predicted ArsR family transcriptional regulator
MSKQTPKAEEMFRKKFETFRELAIAVGEEQAFEKMLEGYPERQKKQLGAFIDDRSLADGFSKAIPIFEKMGMEMGVYDISNLGVDAVIEVQKSCPVLAVCKEYGLAKPCRVICEMDAEASRRAFPGMNVEILSRQADGACVCVFKYERAQADSRDVAEIERVSAEVTVPGRVADLPSARARLDNVRASESGRAPGNTRL